MQQRPTNTIISDSLTQNFTHTILNIIKPLLILSSQYQRLADKYAPGDVEISSTLAKLQLPPEAQAPDRAGFVPLPRRGQAASKQHTAVAIRDGRRAAQRISHLTGRSVGSTTSKSISGSSLRYSVQRTSLSTVLEQDFTIPGKKGHLHCPFSRPKNVSNNNMKPEASHGSGTLDSDRPLTPSDIKDASAHPPGDPICAAMYADSSAPPSATGSAAKCPIRFLDQHSPEEVAAYFETHKHEIPRSHEVCVRRYQRNEDDIRKLDAKYGSLVNMIQGLGQKHQPMLPAKEEQDSADLEHSSNERVENWAHAVSADGVESHEEVLPVQEPDQEDRESRFDRPLKEVRVGESPSRPWGISVPIYDPPERPISPPPAPVSAEHIPKPPGKCPFGHGQALNAEKEVEVPRNLERPPGKCPFGHGAALKSQEQSSPAPIAAGLATKCPFPRTTKVNEEESVPKAQAPPTVQPQPTFIQAADISKSGGGTPQMIFTGPVFIGYPMDQAIAFMQQYKPSS